MKNSGKEILLTPCYPWVISDKPGLEAGATNCNSLIVQCLGLQVQLQVPLGGDALSEKGPTKTKGNTVGIKT